MERLQSCGLLPRRGRFAAKPDHFRHSRHDSARIYGTWWVNTGRGHNELGFDFIDDEQYWIAAVKAGHDLANHTLHHTGARGDADAEWEIGENPRRIWAIEPDQKILLFERGGGTVWDTSEDQIARLLKEYHCVDGRGAPGVDSPAWLINHSAADLRGFVDAAMREGSYHYIIFHGIGPKAEWGGQTDGKAFISLLDYLVEKRGIVWSDTFTKIYKYVEEMSLDLSPYRYISLQFKPSNTNDAITFQFMEALQSEFWEFSFVPRSTDTRTVVIPLTTEYFHHPKWFKSADADGVLDLSNIKLVSLFISVTQGGTIRFERIDAVGVASSSGYLPLREQASTPAITETGRCITGP